MIYFPTTLVGYFLIGDCIQTDMISSMSNGLTKQIAEGVMMAHLISAVPIVVNPPNQYFEELMNIPKCKIHLKIDFIIYRKMLSKSEAVLFCRLLNITAFNWRRCLFRTCLMAFLLIIGLSLPSFGAILDLIGGSTVTITNFILPPVLYVLSMDGSSNR